MSKDKKMRLFITISGDSAEELFAVGPNDLRDHFLPEALNVKPEDVTRIQFEKVEEWGELTPKRYIVHKDNFSKGKTV